MRGKTNKNVQWNQIQNAPNAIARYKEIKGYDMWRKLRKIYKNKKCDQENGNPPSISIFAISIKETLDYFNK